MKGQARDLLHMPFQSGHLSPGIHIPDLDSWIDTANCQPDAVWMPRHNLCARLAGWQINESFPVHCIADRSDIGMIVTDSKLPVVLVEGEAVRRTANFSVVHFL